MNITVDVTDILFYIFRASVFFSIWGTICVLSLALRWGENTSGTREAFIAVLCSIPAILLYLCFFHVKFVLVW